jgi:hypothetical protein
MLWVVTWTLEATHADGVARWVFGADPADAVSPTAALDDKGFGFQISNTTLQGVLHDGTTLTTVDLATTVTTGIVYRLTLKCDGAGKIEWWLDSGTGWTLVGESRLGPTGLSTAGHCSPKAEVYN